MKKTFYILFCFILLLFHSNSYAIETIQLKNRTAEEVIPTIKPFLKEKDAISGNGYQLFIKVDPKTLTEIRPIIEQLDKKLASLMITVKTNKQVDSTKSNVKLSVGPDTNFNAKTTQNHSKNRFSPSARTLEGKRTFVAIGQLQAQPTRQVTRVNGQYIETDIQHLKHKRSGFYATVRLTDDDAIIVDIESELHGASQQNINNILAINTQVRGQLGQWLSLGDINHIQTQQKSNIQIMGTNGRKVMKTQKRDEIYIKVERLD